MSATASAPTASPCPSRPCLLARMRPRASPKPIRVPSGPGAVAERTISSPSSRKVRWAPPTSTGSCPPQVSSMNAPRCSFSGPEIVPEAKRSPVRVGAPLTVRWASIWAGDQYIAAYGGRLTTWPFHSTSRSMSSPHGSLQSEVGQHCRLLDGRGHPGGLQREQGNHPRGDRRGERLAEVGPERHVLPGLDVACGPVVEEHHTEDVLLGPVDRDRFAHRVARADDEAELGLDVEPGRRAEHRGVVRGALALACRAHDVGARHHDRGRAAVVADRQVLPVRRQRVRAVGPEQPPEVRGVVLGGVEVDVVGDLERQVQASRRPAGAPPPRARLPAALR